MTSDERLIKEIELVSDAQNIIMTLLALKRNWLATGEPPSKQILLIEFRKFKKMKKEAEHTEGRIFEAEKKAVNETFKLFEIIVPKFRELD